MNSQFDSEHERYAVYTNEPIDKLTVNRTFERLFEDIDAKTGSSSLRIDGATDKSYGKAKFSSIQGYLFDRPDDTQYQTVSADYETSMLRVSHLNDMAGRFSDGYRNSALFAPVSSDGVEELGINDNRYWLKSDYMDSKFVFMPNGINVVTCSFDLGFNGLAGSIGDDSIVDSDVVSPVSVSGYSDLINIDKESYWNIQDFINDNSGVYADVGDAINIVNMDGRSVVIPFAEKVEVSLRHNKCASTEYSAYRQSYVEVCMSMKLSVKSLFTSKYGNRVYETVTDSSAVSEEVDTSIGEIGRKFRLFVQKPIVMAQVGFYNNESNPSPLVGFDNEIQDGQQERSSRFSSHSRISQKPLDEIDVDGSKVSPVNGFVLVKKYENLYDGDGNIVDNVVHLDVVMKFMAGSMSDPEMEYAMRRLNSRSKVQIAMIGV